MFVANKEKNWTINRWAGYYEAGLWREALRLYGKKEEYVFRSTSFDGRKYGLPF